MVPVDTQVARGEVAYIVWRAETADNHYEMEAEAFTLRGGMIACRRRSPRKTEKRVSMHQVLGEPLSVTRASSFRPYFVARVGPNP